MKVNVLCAGALLALLSAAGISHGQAVLLGQPPVSGGQFTVTAEGANGPGTGLFLESMGPGQPSGLSMGAVGNVGGTGIDSHLGTIGIGFEFLRPYWSFRDFTLAVPVASAGSFSLLGDTGHVDNQFTFAPTVNYQYDFTDMNFGISASGTFLSLSGHLQRDLSAAGTAGGSGHLTAQSQLTIIVANLAEFVKPFNVGDLVGDSSWCADCVKDVDGQFRIGTRYASIDQNYTGSLISSAAGTNSSIRYSSQSFKGIGLTTGLDLYKKISDHFALFSATNFSLLYGNNEKDSTLSVTVAGQPGTSANINESKSVLLPIVEMTLGVEWNTLFGDLAHQDRPSTLMSIRLAAVADYWGGVGPLSAGSTQAYRSSDLFLVGGMLTVGLHR